jgi:hypothetical protein
LHAWKAVLAAWQIDPIRVTLDSTADPDAARPLERAMMQSRPPR